MNTDQLRLNAYKNISQDAYIHELHQFKKWQRIKNKMAKLKKLASYGIIMDAEVRYERVLLGQSSFRGFDQYLTKEIRRLEAAE